MSIYRGFPEDDIPKTHKRRDADEREETEKDEQGAIPEPLNHKASNYVADNRGESHGKGRIQGKADRKIAPGNPFADKYNCRRMKQAETDRMKQLSCNRSAEGGEHGVYQIPDRDGSKGYYQQFSVPYFRIKNPDKNMNGISAAAERAHRPA